jgi:hypothetical protein
VMFKSLIFLSSGQLTLLDWYGGELNNRKKEFTQDHTWKFMRQVLKYLAQPASVVLNLPEKELL